MTAINFGNHELLKITLDEVKDDYDVCIMDCSPGRFLMHDNIFNAADLVLVPNIPAPLSVYCNNMLTNSLQDKKPYLNKLLSFYNMVQVNKNLHRQYLDNRKDDTGRILSNYIPFYAEIELITLTKESIFHQLKEFRANIYYHKLWMEICERMQWQLSKGIVVDIQKEPPAYLPEQNDNEAPLTKSSNG